MRKKIVFITWMMMILPAVSINHVYAQDKEKAESTEVKEGSEALEEMATKKALAAMIFQLAGIDKELKQVANKQIKLAFLAKHLSNRATAKSPKEAKIKEKIMVALAQVFEKDINIVDEMKPLVENQFATAFSEAELQYMIDFYKSEIGKKLVKTTPLIANEVMKQTISKLSPRVNVVLKDAITEETAKAKSPDI